MKKTALTILMAAAAITAFGQTGYDAALFSENNYEGTARSVAMGNAFTALGGDLGAVSINPAGSAVARYSQFTLTPSITISGSTTSGVLPPMGNELLYFDKTYRNTDAAAGIPNLGFSFNFDSGRTSGLKSLTIGFILNRTNSWCENTYARGTNYTTSFAGAAAAAATGNFEYYNRPDVLPAGDPRYTSADLIHPNAYNFYDPWSDIVRYRSGIISTFDDSKEKFIGATEVLLDDQSIKQGGPLDQTYGRSVNGSKYEYVFNIGANISDFLYIGFNLGINSLTYEKAVYFRETAIDPSNFPNTFVDASGAEKTTNFREMLHKSSYAASGSGVFGKLGVILTPGYGLRIGAAIQTPTSNTIDERWGESASTSFSDASFNGSESSPTGEYRYMFNSPFRANFGLAYTLGNFGVISADYELADYRTMKYKINMYEMSDQYINHFQTVNEDIKNTFGVAHQFRAGLEVKPLSELAVRAGYNLSTSAEKYDLDGNRLAPFYRQNVSFGLGYISKKSFFADIACRYTFVEHEDMMPYDDYQFDSEGQIVEYSPELLIKTSDWKILLTLGWRF